VVSSEKPALNSSPKVLKIGASRCSGVISVIVAGTLSVMDGVNFHGRSILRLSLF
jgi:hypothetical protein